MILKDQKKFTFIKNDHEVKTILFFISIDRDRRILQEYIFGKVKSEFGNEIADAIVINVRTDEKVLSDRDGNFMIASKPTDELRIVKSGFERFQVKITSENFTQPLNVALTKVPYLIPEVEIAFQPTGNIRKDSKTLDPPKKVVALNSSMDTYMKSPSTEVQPRLKTPSAFAGPNFSAGQVNVIGLVSAAVGLLTKATSKPITQANYAETQQFYNRIKLEVDLSFYTQQGWDEEEIDRFLIYADKSFSLAKKYRDSFPIDRIAADMRMAYIGYIKTRKVKS